MDLPADLALRADCEADSENLLRAHPKGCRSVRCQVADWIKESMEREAVMLEQISKDHSKLQEFARALSDLRACTMEIEPGIPPYDKVKRRQLIAAEARADSLLSMEDQ